MLKNLVIVESPAKAKTIEKFLGKDYKVMSSYGHIRDLKKKNFGVDVDNNFAPLYEIPADKASIVDDLRKAAAEADTVWLASDEDREGEAIAWHLAEVLGLDPATTKRIVFHEITKKAILHALANPRTIDMGLVDAQQARRVLDRIVGFELSPVLWKKIKPSLSAGRVQSVAVRLIVEREMEIRDFTPEPFFRVTAHFAATGGRAFRADLGRRLHSEPEAADFLAKAAKGSYSVADISVKPQSKAPAPPFTTSTLQQEAARKLGFSVSQTMSMAQRLYEAGHITYMRTDSLNLSAEAVNAISDEIISSMGKEYLHPRQYHTSSKGAQEAHEAIRPTDISVRELPEGNPIEKRLYNLIWKRAVASQMADAHIERTTVEIANPADPEARFTASGEVVKFDGFLRVYSESRDDEPAASSSSTATLPALEVGEPVATVEISATERFTQQPPRYTEASLVKKLEELGIGRPSTYAPTISTIQNREYVEKGEKEGQPRSYVQLTLEPDGEIARTTATESVGSEKGKLVPTDTGVVVNQFLTEYFPDILDYNFTARVEEKFDEIAEGSLPWPDEIRTFYDLFHPEVDKALNMRLEHKIGERVLGTDPASGKPVSVKIGRFGPLVQIGDADNDHEKPQFASLLKGQSIADITLDEALKLFEFPRVLGTFEDKDVSVSIGRFGPYVRLGSTYVSIPKTMAPAEVSLDEAIQLILKKREDDARKVVKVFPGEDTPQILNGRYGVYIAYNKRNYKLPKTVTDPAALSLDECMEIIRKEDEKPAKPRRAAKKA